MRYSVLLLFLLAVASGWAQDTTRVKKMNAELSKIASQTKNNGKWIFIKPDQKIKSDDFLKNKKALNLSDKSSFKKLKATPLKDAYAMEKHQQYHNNIRIVDAITVIYTNNGNVERVQGDILEDKPESNTFKLTEKQVITKALEQLPSTEYAWQNDKLEADLKSKSKNPAATNYPQPEKVYFQKDDKLFAAYELWIVSNKPSYSYKVILDAETGLVLRKLTNQYECFGNHTATKNVCTHSENEPEHHTEILNEKSESSIVDDCQVRYLPTAFYGDKLIYTYPDDEYGNFRLSSNCNNIEYNLKSFEFDSYVDSRFYLSSSLIYPYLKQQYIASNTTLYGLQKATEYYKLKFNRNGYDNDFGDLNVIQDAEFNIDSDKYSNATFSPTTFGNNELRFGNNEGKVNTSVLDDWNTIDIVGHEFTHGVIYNESKLKYEGESGALNESFADIFGNLLEVHLEGEHEKVWMVGEDRAKNHLELTVSGALRSMNDPKLKNNPDTYKGEFWKNTALTDVDNGGVHVNSGVQNHFFYLLCKGGTGVNDKGYNYDVQGLGIEIGQFLAYKTMQALTSSSDYYDARIAWLTQAEIHYGKCSAVVLAVKEAWAAVGVNAFDDFLHYCDQTIDTDIVGSPAFRDSQNQTQIGGDKEGGVPCEVVIRNSGNNEATLTAKNKILIYSNTTIPEGTKLTLKVSDPCEW